MVTPYERSPGISERWKSSCVLVSTPLNTNWPSGFLLDLYFWKKSTDQSPGLQVEVFINNGEFCLLIISWRVVVYVWCYFTQVFLIAFRVFLRFMLFFVFCFFFSRFFWCNLIFFGEWGDTGKFDQHVWFGVTNFANRWSPGEKGGDRLGSAVFVDHRSSRSHVGLSRDIY